MHTWTKRAFAAVLLLGVAVDANAQCGSHKKAAGTDVAQASHKDGARGSCHSKDEPGCRGKALAATGMPLMIYKVGEMSTNCPKEAHQLATESEATVRYVVGTNEFEEKTEALKAYAAALDEYLGTLTTVRYAVGDTSVGCSQAAAALARESRDAVKFRVASFTFADESAARQAAEAARSAADKVVMKKLVDGEEVAVDGAPAKDGKSCGAAKSGGQKTGGTGECATKKSDKSSCGANKLASRSDACPSHKASGDAAATVEPASERSAKCEFVVGDVKTCCETTARVELAQTRILEAHKTLTEVAAKDTPGKPVAGI